jgi:hypothetical protein
VQITFAYLLEFAQKQHDFQTGKGACPTKTVDQASLLDFLLKISIKRD